MTGRFDHADSWFHSGEGVVRVRDLAFPLLDRRAARRCGHSGTTQLRSVRDNLRPMLGLHRGRRNLQELSFMWRL
jgi:hypothetical protein